MVEKRKEQLRTFLFKNNYNCTESDVLCQTISAIAAAVQDNRPTSNREIVCHLKELKPTVCERPKQKRIQEATNTNMTLFIF